MNFSLLLIRNRRTMRLQVFSPILLTIAALGFVCPAQSQTIKFVAPQRLLNSDGVPDHAYKALLGHFHSPSLLDIAFAGISFEFTTPHSYSDVALNLGSGSFNVISSNTGSFDQNPGADIAADLDGDGLTDLVSLETGGFTVQFAVGDGTFTSSSVLFPVGSATTTVTSMVAADFDGNGTTDLAAFTSTNRIIILLNDGHGVFHTAFNYAGPASANGFGGLLAVGDINGDTLPDLAAIAGGTVTPYLSTHGGALAQGTSYAVGADGQADIKDINRDGHGDVVFVTRTGVGILLGSSSGQMMPGKNIALPNASELLLVDVNKDNLMDVVVLASAPAVGTHPNPSAYLPTVVDVYLGNGNGTFQNPTAYGVGNQTVSLLAGDLYGKGNLDLVTLDAGDASLTLLKNNGNGSYQAATVTHSSNATGIVAGDFNRDGKQDIAVVNTATCPSPCRGTVTVIPGSGSNFFNAGKSYAIGMHGSAIAAGDLNGDGVLDLVAVNSVAGDAFDTSVLLGNADGTFRTAHNYKLGSLSNEVFLMDVNHDGHLDLLTAGGVALGKGDGSFGVRKPFPNLAYGPDMHFAVGDVNRDGKLDVVAVTSANCSMTMQVLQGDGKGGFTAGAVVYDSDSEPVNSIALGQLKPGGPLAIAYSFGGECFISSGADFSSGAAGFAGPGDGTFPTALNFFFGAPMGDPIVTGPVVFADFNGDGNGEVGVGAQGFFVVNGQKFAASAGPLGLGTELQSAVVANGIAVGDFLKDGKLDVVLTSGLGVARLYNVTPK